ncbi:MAG: exlusion protein FxsA [Alphaproteobacteria bacterium CG_4_10_14_0_2_um_filter_63_37]|nr:MAG: hypothetical protein AUJ55_10265 [Proteobacteria bacterium CG1_02_64_396]PJA25598.1 MAG: exlusion protein FxsA [Alphaproteobacteria bacterium CG_4_10_14_0_2_um_filter_63_37]
MFRILLVLFIAVPLIEIGLFIQVGGWIGLWPTLLIVLLTAVIGAWHVRREGLGVIARLQHDLASGRPPARALVEGAVLLVAGALLLTPGFFTDAVGFTLLTPWARDKIFQTLKRRVMPFEVIDQDPFG